MEDYVTAFILAALFFWAISALDDWTSRKSKGGFISEQRENKKQNKEAVYGLPETNHPLTNNDVEMMLGISDATATRYFDELEKEGKVKQVGKTGRGVNYERI